MFQLFNYTLDLYQTKKELKINTSCKKSKQTILAKKKKLIIKPASSVRSSSFALSFFHHLNPLTLPQSFRLSNCIA